MTFVPDTGDFVGLTILLMANDRRTSAVVQEGLGGLEPAFVAETTIASDGSFSIEFPPSSLERGVWKARLLGDELLVTSPQAETMRLKSSCD